MSGVNFVDAWSLWHLLHEGQGPSYFIWNSVLLKFFMKWGTRETVQMAREILSTAPLRNKPWSQRVTLLAIQFFSTLFRGHPWAQNEQNWRTWRTFQRHILKMVWARLPASRGTILTTLSYCAHPLIKNNAPGNFPTSMVLISSSCCFRCKVARFQDLRWRWILSTWTCISVSCKRRGIILEISLFRWSSINCN